MRRLSQKAPQGEAQSPETVGGAYPHPMSLTRHFLQTLRLAGPVMLSRVGMLLMAFTDTAMVGHTSMVEMAALSISFSPQMLFLVIGIGLLVGTVVLTAQAEGMGRRRDSGRVWRTGLLIALGLGAVIGGLFSQGDVVMQYLDQEAAVAARGAKALEAFAPGMAPMLMVIATTLFLEGLGRPIPGMLVSLGGVALNAGLDWLLIFGHWGMEPGGAVGANVATTLTRWVMLLALLFYVAVMPDRHRYGIGRWRWPGRQDFWRTLRLGLPLALAIGLESICFFMATVMAGWLAPGTLAAFQIMITLITNIFMLAIGTSTAAAVRVGNAIGRGDAQNMARAGWIAVAMIIGIDCMVALALAGGGVGLIRLMTDVEPVQAMLLPLLPLLGLFILVDGAQGTLAGAVRGAADVLASAVIAFISFGLVGIGTLHLLTLTLGWGLPGLLWGLLAAVTCAAILYTLRFHTLSRRVIRPVAARAMNR